jgi:DNA polymerase-3 subunit alpha
MNFTHLNVHSKASMLYGSADIKDIIARTKELGQDAVAITDYANVFDAISFYRAAQSADIKPILGVDLYFCEDAEQTKIQKIRQVTHIILLAENDIGWKNITRIVSKANSPEYFYYNPRVDFKLLEQYSEGVICLTGSSFDGVISYNLYDKENAAGEISEPAALFKAEGLVRRFLKIFDKDHLYLEVQNTGFARQDAINNRLRNIARKYGLRTVATGNVHYVHAHDAEAHKTLLEMSTNKYNRSTYTDFDSEQYYIKSREELEQLDFRQDELDLAYEIGERCNVDIDIKKRRLPKYQFVPEGKTSMEYLRELVEGEFLDKGFYEHPYNTSEYKKRLERELADIEEMGFADYFLIVHDVVSWVHSKGILMGRGAHARTA